MHTHKHVQAVAGASVARHGQTTPAEMSQLLYVLVQLLTSERSLWGQTNSQFFTPCTVEMPDELIWSNKQTWGNVKVNLDICFGSEIQLMVVNCVWLFYLIFLVKKEACLNYIECAPIEYFKHGSTFHLTFGVTINIKFCKSIFWKGRKDVSKLP